MGIALGPDDWAIRCNLVTIENEEMRDFKAGHISNAEGRALMEAITASLGVPGTLEFYPGVSYRNIMAYRGHGHAPFSLDTKTQPPHDIPDRPIGGYLPHGPGGDVLRELMERSREVLREHPVNQARTAARKRPATQIWLWGQGCAPRLRPFAELYGKHGAIISGVDLVRGVGILLGWARIDVPGVTDYLDNDYVAQGRATIEALRRYDLVCAHVEAPDEASHEGKVDAKVKALEAIDQHLVGPLMDSMRKLGDWRILVSPDHRTPLRTRAHAHGAVPFAMAGTGIVAGGHKTYDEATAASSDVAFEKGHELMSVFLG